jgi:hypothetical protein
MEGGVVSYVMLDISMPELNGLDAGEQVNQKNQAIKHVYVTQIIGPMSPRNDDCPPLAHDEGRLNDQTVPSCPRLKNARRPLLATCCADCECLTAGLHLDTVL